MFDLELQFCCGQWQNVCLKDIYGVCQQVFFLGYRIPNVTVSTDEGDVELEISDDPHDCRRLDVSSIPVTVTLSKV